MTTRHQAREWAVQLLYVIEHNDAETAIDDFWDTQKDKPTARAFAEELYYGVIDNINAIDARLTRYAENWRLDRMNAVDRNVMRLALYEFFHRTDIPPVATLDEAITLAKELSSEDSGRFVNGILDRAIKDLDRPLRSANKAYKTASPPPKPRQKPNQGDQTVPRVPDLDESPNPDWWAGDKDESDDTDESEDI